MDVTVLCPTQRVRAAESEARTPHLNFFPALAGRRGRSSRTNVDHFFESHAQSISVERSFFAPQGEGRIFLIDANFWVIHIVYLS